MDEPALETGPDSCRNCGAPLRGEYCHHCGQHEGRGDLQFADAAGDVLGDVVRWDSRLWRTLFPLVFRPGFLTAEFIEGRRARYLPPFRLYIIISFLMFLVLSLLAQDIVDISDDGDGLQVVSSIGDTADPNDVAEAEAAIADAQAQLDELGIPIDIREQTQGVNDEGDVRVITPASITDDRAEDDDVDIGLADPNSPFWLQDLDERIENNAKRLRDDPQQFIELMLDYMPQMMFMMLPLFALLLKLCYLLSPYHYLQHLVFGLHYHSFVYLLFLLGETAERLTAIGDGWLFLALVIYMPLALRRAYQSSIAGAIAKSFVVYISYGLLLLLSFAAVVVLAVALM